MVKLSRDKAGSSKTSTEFPVLDLACTAEIRVNRERQSAPRDGNILSVYVVSDKGGDGECANHATRIFISLILAPSPRYPLAPLYPRDKDKIDSLNV